MKVSELDGPLLDAAVAMANGWEMQALDGKEWWWSMPAEYRYTSDNAQTKVRLFKPSESWAYGGPIIERERIELQNHACSEGWWAGIRQSPSQNKAGGVTSIGPTPLIAAMRAYVASKLGNEVVL